MNLVYRYRVKNLNGLLNRQARAVNYVFNYCNDVQKQALKWGKKWPTGFDLNNLTAGSSKHLGLHSGTIQAVCQQYANSRRQHNRPYLRWRTKKSLGWVPFKGRDLKREGNDFRFHGNTFRVFNGRPLPSGKICDGSNFSQDAKGNWYLNVVVEAEAPGVREPKTPVGIDLGLKEFATLSTGEAIENPRHYRSLEEQLGIAQRARKKKQARNIHQKIRNRRRNELHKLSNRLTKEFDFIAVGNVSSSKLAKTKMAKSVNDASWHSFKTMLLYKSIRNGGSYEEVNESYTTQTCSACGALPEGRPKGIAGLGIRHWVCAECGAQHNRDVNAAINILARSGYRPPVVGAA